MNPSAISVRPASRPSLLRQTRGMSLPGEGQPLDTGQYKDIEDPERVFLLPTRAHASHPDAL